MPLHLRGILALLLVTAVWGTTFPAMKDLSGDLSAVWIVLLRFALGGMLLSPFLLRGKAIDLGAGAMLGALLFVCCMFQFEGLALTSSNRNAFITGLNVLVVPLLGVFLGRLPERRIVLAVLLAVAGLFVMCWDGESWGRGDWLALCGAFFFGLYVKMIEVMTRKAGDMMALTAAQLVTVALCAALWLLLVDARGAPSGGTLAAHGWNLLYLGAIATAAIISLQTWGQRHCSANEAAVTYSLEPACAAVAAYFWLGESMTPRGIFGALLLLAGMIVSQWTPKGKAGLAGARLAPDA
jgi:drug/metabolite transporter (DMT)-like permease